VNSQDIFHNAFIPIDRATGQPMANFNERWRAGMVAMLQQFRALMPAAILDGHAMDVSDGNITALFNAISIGFTVPFMVEQQQSFSSGLSMYRDWMSLPARSPKVTMVESAVRLMLGYGYGFDRDLETEISSACANSESVPGAPVPGIGDACAPRAAQRAGYISPPTFLLARAEYRYMRFGLGFTLMDDGFFTHELGDSWHGQDWLYDELLFSLGLPRGGATQAAVYAPGPPPPLLPPIPLPAADWSLYVRTPDGSNASWTMDAAQRPPVAGAPASARVDVQGTAPSSDGIDLSQVVTAFRAGGYLLSFWARASRNGTRVTLNSRKNGGDWHSFGLDATLTFTTEWTQYNVTFTSVADGSAGRLSWFFGAAASGTSLWVNAPALTGYNAPPPCLLREFDCGVVVLNGDAVEHTVLLPAAAAAGLQRLAGEQAPRWQYFVDDNSSDFSTQAGDWQVQQFDSGYDQSTPSQEQVRPADGFYHHWGVGAHQAAAGSSAVFALRAPAPGAYNVSLWWPAAVPARAAWARAMTVSIDGALQSTVDLSAQGGDAFFLVAANVQLTAASTLTLACPAGGGECIADAVLVESAARWNDGSAVLGGNVTLQGTDAIVLRRTIGAPASCGAVAAEPPR